MKLPTPIFLCILLVFTIAGYWFGKEQAKGSEETVVAETSREAASIVETSENSTTAEETKDDTTLHEDKSLKEVFALDYSPARAYRIGMIFADMTLENSADMLAYIKANFTGVEQRNMLNRYYSRMGRLDGENTFAEVLASNNRYRLEQLSSVAKGWAIDDPRAAWSALMEVSDNGAVWKVNTGSPMWEIARRDPALAVQLVQELKDHDYVLRHMGQVLSGAALAGGYKDVLEETLKVENPSLRNQMLNRLFEKWGEVDFEEPSQALASFTDPEQTDKAMRGMLLGWARVDGKGAFEYVLENRDDPLIGNSLVQVANEWALNSTASELEDFVTNLPEGHDWDDLTMQVSYNLARVNPMLAMDMSTEIKDEQKKARAVGSSMYAWTRSDLDGAEQYFEDLDEGKAKTWARYSLASANIELQNDSAAAIEYLNTVPDTKERTDLLNWLSNRLSQNPNGIYRQEDIDSFATLLADNQNFTEAEKKAALDRLKK